jgi:hypothetical protein
MAHIEGDRFYLHLCAWEYFSEHAAFLECFESSPCTVIRDAEAAEPQHPPPDTRLLRQRR